MSKEKNQLPLLRPKFRFPQEEVVNYDVPKGYEETPDSGGLHPAPDWKNSGEAVWGVLIDIRENVGQHKSRVYIIHDEAGGIVGVWGTTVLDSRLKEGRPQPGDKVMIQFTGVDDETKGAKATKLFRVRVVRQVK
jgi:hypothetical protein